MCYAIAGTKHIPKVLPLLVSNSLAVSRLVSAPPGHEELPPPAHSISVYPESPGTYPAGCNGAC